MINEREGVFYCIKAVKHCHMFLDTNDYFVEQFSHLLISKVVVALAPCQLTKRLKFCPMLQHMRENMLRQTLHGCLPNDTQCLLAIYPISSALNIR